MKNFRRKPLANAISVALTGSVIATGFVGTALGTDALEEIVVTASKRTSSLQDLPLSVQVLGNQQLEELFVNGFEDYIAYIPTVSFTSNGPGYSQVYMRGIASGGDGNHSASMPSVGVYLDEQPITTINQVLDIQIYDIARIETLSGPQGTLYGQGSQSGTLRIITNKPEIGEFSSAYDVRATTTKSGEMGYGLNGFVNIPISDRAAIRLVGWTKKDGGYIDNVPSSITYAASGISINNAAVVEQDFNDSEVSGARALLKVDLNEDWTVTPGLMYQKADATGVWYHDPDDLGDLQAQRFFVDSQDESWYQATLTVDGNIGDLNLVYAGSYLDRDVNSLYDYSGYAEYLEDTYYYLDCLYYDAQGGCADPSQYVIGDETFSRWSHEIRLQSSSDNRFRWIVGAFAQEQEHNFDLQWVVPDMNPADSVIENGITTWQTYQVRNDRDKAAFGEVTYDFTDRLTGTAGVRLFDYENSLFGFNGFIGHCTGSYVDGVFVEDRVNGTPQYPCFDTRILDDVSEGDGETYKLNLSYQIDEDKMIYGTYSEGFRSGGVNRARVPGIPKYQPDFVYNYEFGWKTTYMDGRLRFNGAVYFVQWDDFQFGFLDFTVSNLTIVQNVGQAETTGLEFDLTLAATDELTLSLSGSYNDAELIESFWRNDNDRLAGDPPTAPAGTKMPYVPKVQFTAVGRYAMDFGSLPGHVQLAVSHTGDSWNNLEVAARRKQDAYTLVSGSIGVRGDTWSLELYGNNLTDERAQINRIDPGYPSAIDTTISVNRPRSFGIRFGQKF